MEIFSGTQSSYGRHVTRQTFRSGRSEAGQKMESMKEFSEQLQAAAPFVGTALFGCLLQTFKSRWQGWKNFAASALSAGFGAWLVSGLVGDVMSPGWGIFASGMVGYSGGTLVDVALSAFTHKVEHMDKLTKSAGQNDSMED